MRYILGTNLNVELREMMKFLNSFTQILKLLFNDCGYDHSIEDEMFRDHIVFGLV
jgi:hypothetical protein